MHSCNRYLTWCQEERTDNSMAEGLKPPQAFTTTLEAAKEWPQWRDHFTFYMTATKKDKEDEKTKVAILLTAMGGEAISVYRTFTWAADGDEDKLDCVIRAFNNYFKPKSNEIYERFLFLQRKQQPNEPFDSFYTDLLRLVETCGYHQEEKTKIIRDQIVINITADNVREKLLAESDLTLTKAVDMCRSMEATTRYIASMTSTATALKECVTDAAAVHMVKAMKQRPCHYCATNHKPKNCPAWGKQCKYCGIMNHTAEACKKAEKDRLARRQTTKETANAISPQRATPDTPENEERDHFAYCTGTTTQTSKTKAKVWNIILDIGGRGLKAKIDTGATCNILPFTAYRVLCASPPTPTEVQLTAYGGTKLDVCGKTTMEATFQGVTRRMEFIIVRENVETLIGLPSITDLGLIQQTLAVDATGDTPTAISEFKDVFKGLGRLPGEYSIKLKTNAQPVIQPARRVPFRYRQELKSQLDEMEKQGIIAKVTEATNWVSPIVLVTKPGKDKLRICIDPGALNKAIQREHYQLKTPEEIFGTLAGSQYFSTLDATSGFLQIALDKESSYLTTVATPFGRYRYCRLPFGISSAPEVFHRIVTESFADIPGVHTYVDDILVSGCSIEEHDKRLQMVLERCRELNLRLNRSKCQFRKTELKYLGHVLTSEGIKPDPEKVEAIEQFPKPQSKTDVSRLLGLVTYLSKFCPTLAETASPLRQLTQQETAWVWDSVHDRTLQHVKDLVTKAPVLRLFDPALPVRLTVDASQHGLGAAVIQEGHPVEYASRTMSSIQQKYAQIEKEMLAIQFGLTRFHQYVYGQDVIVETDHKPLLGILKKPLAEVSPRLQRMRLRCLKYNYTLEHHSGKEMVLADSLSRMPSTTPYTDYDELTEEQIDSVTEQIIPTPLGRERCTEATRQDPTMQALITYIHTGWPPTRRSVPGPIKPYWNVRHDLTEKDGIVLKGSQAVVPVTMRKTVMNSIHEGHYGIVKCIERAKTSVYWPGYTNEIHDMVASCSKCQENRSQNPKPDTKPHDVPHYPYQKVGTDLFELQGEHYLLTIDYYSKWVTIDHLQSTKAADVITILDKHFANFGIPETIFSDNGPQYANEEFRKFSRKLGFQHTTSSPGYPASNGQAERGVQTVKKMMAKMLEEGRTINDALRVLRNTPIGGDLPTPAILLQGRHLRTQLTINTETLVPHNMDADKTRQKLIAHQSQYAFYGATGNTTNSPLLPDESVRTMRGKKWVPAKVIGHHTEPQSYILRLANGRTVRRTRTHINRTTEVWDDNTMFAKYTPTGQQTNTSLPEGQPPNQPEETNVLPDTEIRSPNTESPPKSAKSPTTPASQPAVKTTRLGRISRPPRRLLEDYTT